MSEVEVVRVGILTITGLGNYGNRLQNYALQSSMSRMAKNEVVTLQNSVRTGEGGSSVRRRLSRIRSEGPRLLVQRTAHTLGIGRHSRPVPAAHVLSQGRKHAIQNFVVDYVGESSRDYSSTESTSELAQLFNIFVVGSDQVWNPVFGLRNHLRFLEFAEPRQRVAYAASFGVADLPAHLRKTYRSGISGMAHVSVREQRAAEMVRELTGREVPVVLDPTMLLIPAEWESLAKTPQSLTGGGYVAEFFLGTATDEEMRPVHQFAAARGLDRVDLRSDTPEDLAVMGPLEFIGAIKASNLLVTDSFHAAVFATIFRVPYLLKGRGAMNSRFDTLLSKSGLPMPKWGNLRELEASIDIDWDLVHQNIARERALSLDYLRTALSLPTTRDDGR